MAIPKSARLVAKERLTANVVELTFRMIDPPELGYDSGKYIIVTTTVLKESGAPVKRAYSIASPPADQTIFRLSFKVIESGAATNFLANLADGAEIQFSGPWGKNFHLPAELDPRQRFFFIASGTAFSAMHGHLWRLAENAAWRGRADFHWGLRRRADFYHGEALKRFEDDPRFHVGVTYSDEPGGRMLDRALADGSIAVEPNALYYLAGNGTMIENVTQALAASGVDVDRIFKEIYFS